MLEHENLAPGPPSPCAMILLHHATRNKTVNALRQLGRDHARTIGYFEPLTTILDHLAFSPMLSARAVWSTGRIFSGVFTRSFMMTVVAPLTVVLHARWPKGGFMVPGLVLGASSERKSSLRCVRPLSSSPPSSSRTLRAEG